MKAEAYMRRAIELAQKGRGFTNPNPMVGAVIVKEGKIIGEGYHERYGELHAERNALASCRRSPKGAVMYVTLEPCCHYGKTPPCTEAIIEAGIGKVVVGSRDPNPKVAGKGVKILREAGIEVQEDFLREECDRINPVFFHYIRTSLPYVALKYAMTADGKIAAWTGKSQWITGQKARNHVHLLRHYYKGIMAGIGTVAADDPMLNCRREGLQSPVRIICDSHLQISPDSRLCRSARDYPLIIGCAQADEYRKKELEKLGAEVLCCPGKDGHVSMADLLKNLGQRGIDSLLVEGGATINSSMIQTGMVKKCYVYVGGKILGGEQAKGPVAGPGAEDPEHGLQLIHPQITIFDDDVLLEYDVKQ
ncbi:MAG: bifunctional diaminohydroxyphosphoribosylaminopyrimidine deaminase/5-amino-6-(5-phosphoribosylamino)uracil reductase RibD [Ruminococcus sp.]|jgi:diaminohydroxyphosphoribosylaminopyrimidine deaminase/5-amino-6-(5-phosphoribosylamino)uracil reductase